MLNSFGQFVIIFLGGILTYDCFLLQPILGYRSGDMEWGVLVQMFHKEHSRNRIGTEMEQNKCGTRKESGNKVGTNDECLLLAPPS